MIIGVLKEHFDKKVGLVPATIKKLIKKGYTVIVESTAGRKSFISNPNFEASGAEICTRENIFEKANIIISYTPLKDEEIIQKQIKNKQFDTIYHEHFSYYSLISITSLLKKYDLKIFKVQACVSLGIACQAY